MFFWSERISRAIIRRDDRQRFFAPAYGNRAIRQLTAASATFYHNLLDGLVDRSVLHPRGELLIARVDQLGSLDKMEAELRTENDALERLDADAITKRLPALRPGYAAAALADDKAKDMDVAAIHQAYLKGFRHRGGRLVVDAEVMRLQPLEEGWRIETKAGVFEAEVVINAAGAWADEIGAMAGAMEIGLVPKRRTAFIFDPAASIDPAWPVVIDIDEAFYFKPESGLLLGSPADETNSPPCDAQPEELDVAIAVDRIQSATTWQVARIPRRWAGLRSFVPDKTPVVGFDPHLNGFFWLAGQGGYGIQTAPALSRAAAALALGRRLPDDIAATGLQAADLAPHRLMR